MVHKNNVLRVPLEDGLTKSDVLLLYLYGATAAPVVFKFEIEIMTKPFICVPARTARKMRRFYLLSHSFKFVMLAAAVFLFLQ